MQGLDRVPQSRTDLDREAAALGLFDPTYRDGALARPRGRLFHAMYSSLANKYDGKFLSRKITLFYRSQLALSK